MQEISIDRTIYTTKPEPGSRLPVEMATYDLLEKLQIPFFAWIMTRPPRLNHAGR